MAEYPTANSARVSATSRYAPGAPTPLPNPTANGSAVAIAVSGAAVATTMNTMPSGLMAPARRPSVFSVMLILLDAKDHFLDHSLQ